jgi:hypothetical protein
VIEATSVVSMSTWLKSGGFIPESNVTTSRYLLFGPRIPAASNGKVLAISLTMIHLLSDVEGRTLASAFNRLHVTVPSAFASAE